MTHSPKVSETTQRRGKSFAWPQAATAMLVDLWEKNETCRSIAQALNAAGFGPYSPSAVSGRANRLEVTRRPSPLGVGPGRQDPLTKRDNGQQRPIKVCSPHKRCQWPVGDPKDPEFKFCSEPVFNGYSYCRDHVEQAYVPGTWRDA